MALAFTRDGHVARAQPRMNDLVKGRPSQIHARGTRQCGCEIGLHRQAVFEAGGLNFLVR
jgi:hypothetical protein